MKKILRHIAAWHGVSKQRVEIRRYIPCKNQGCTEDTESYFYEHDGVWHFVENAYEAILHDGKAIYVCSVGCQQVAIQRSKEMAR